MPPFSRVALALVVLWQWACSSSLEGQEQPGPAGGAGSPGSGASSNTAGSSGAGSAGSASNTAGGAAGTPATSAGQGGVATGGAPTAGAAGSGNGSSGGGAGGSPPVVTNECKRGIAWASNEATNAALLPGISWWYNWGPNAGATAAGLEFVPMIWGGEFDVGELVDDIPAGVAHVLGFNEPNYFVQANLSAQQAAAAWPGVEDVAEQRGLGIASPAVNFCGDDAAGTGPCHDTNPVSYLTDFFASCQGCKVDYVAVHWYNCTAEDLIWYLDQFRAFGKPIWLTEFACAYNGDTSLAGQEEYMRAALPVLEADPDIGRYAWFSGDPLPNARLLDDSGELTPLGQIYVDLPREPCAQ